MSFEMKYLKYKMKYLALKNQAAGAGTIYSMPVVNNLPNPAEISHWKAFVEEFNSEGVKRKHPLIMCNDVKEKKYCDELKKCKWDPSNTATPCSVNA